MEIKKELYYDCPWLEVPKQAIEGMLAKGQMPHALLLNGPWGTGRRALALWLAGTMLGVAERIDPGCLTGVQGSETEPLPTHHPDLLVLQPEPEKRVINVAQVRQLIDFMQLTSHQGGAKIAIVYPAQALNRNSANALLKVLEEPPAGSLIVLIADLPSQLPATIVSRCHRLRVKIPRRDESIHWLDKQSGQSFDWQRMLDFSGGAPLRALDLAVSGFATLDAQLEQDIRDLLARKQTPSAVSKKWASEAKKGPGDQTDLYVRWLFYRVCRVIRSQILRRGDDPAPGADNTHLQNGAKNLNMQPFFAYLGELAEFRRLDSTALNKELNLNSLLMWWYGGFSAPEPLNS